MPGEPARENVSDLLRIDCQPTLATLGSSSSNIIIEKVSSEDKNVVVPLFHESSYRTTNAGRNEGPETHDNTMKWKGHGPIKTNVGHHEGPEADDAASIWKGNGLITRNTSGRNNENQQPPEFRNFATFRRRTKDEPLTIVKQPLPGREEQVLPGAEFVPWGPLGPPDRVDVVITAAVVPSQPVQNTLPGPIDESDELVLNLLQSKLRRRKYLIYIAIVTGILIALGVAVGTGVSGGKQAEATLSSTTTIMEPWSSSCAFWFNAKQPNVITQCTCTGSISVVATDVAAAYEKLLTQGIIKDIFPVFNNTIESCDPLNQALVWLASGNGKPTPDANLLQRYILALLYIAWNGQRWIANGGWLSPSDECTWNGVTCNTNHDVVGLKLDNNHKMNGHLKSEIGRLTSLTSLSLLHNGLQGTLPTELGNLSKLTTLMLDDNSFNGTIPTQLGLLSDLQTLRLSFNEISGKIPTEVGLLRSLRLVTMSNNTLSGQLPTEIGLWSAESISLDMNKFQGPIPTEIGYLSKLKQFSVSLNRINGTIPSELFHLETLEVLNFEINHLSGSIPSIVGKLSQLGQLLLGNNRISGSIPTALGLCTNIVYLALERNNINGTVPTELGSLSQLLMLDLDFNNLTGSVPNVLCQITRPITCIPTLHCNCGCTCNV